MVLGGGCGVFFGGRGGGWFLVVLGCLCGGFCLFGSEANFWIKSFQILSQLKSIKIVMHVVCKTDQTAKTQLMRHPVLLFIS